MIQNLSELLLTHHVGGRWRAPLSQRMRDVRAPDGRLIGRLVEAEAPDLARVLAAARLAVPALAELGAEGRAALVARLLDELAARAPLVEAARRREGFSGGHAPLPVALPPLPPGGPVGLLGTVSAPPGLAAGALAAALRAGHPVLLKPAPRAPFAALALGEAALAAGLPPGALGLVQGGGQITGAGLVRLPGLAGVFVLGRPPRAGMSGAATLG